MTICTQGHVGLFGDIKGDHEGRPYTKLNDAGKLMGGMWRGIPEFFGNVDVDEYVIMPNHIHGILIIKNMKGRPQGSPVQEIVGAGLVPAHKGLGEIIGAYKSLTTNEYIKKIRSDNWPKFDKRIWQRNYFERIIRNEEECFKIKNYIRMNPLMWERDRNNLANAE